jgi:lysophospholipase L1-like esterase
MKIKIICIWLVCSVPIFAAQSSPLIECAPRGGLPNFFNKVVNHQTVRIAYLGGSITAQEGWRPKTLNWFRQEYGQSNIIEINAAIGGTGSDLGAFRLRHDVLDQNPDLIFVEFAVNDSKAPPEQIYRTMEGIVRQTWHKNPEIDICFVYTIAEAMLAPLNRGELPSSYAAMEKIAEHYGIPSLNLGLNVARLEKEGKLVFKGAKPQNDAEKQALDGKVLFSPDGVHPYTDTGHQLYFNAIVRCMKEIKTAGNAAPHALVEPFVANNWENAKILPMENAKLSGVWTKLDPATNTLAGAFTKRLPEIWKADRPGAAIEFFFKGTDVAIYDIIGPDCGQVSIVLDDKPLIVYPLFDSYCTYYRLSLLKIGSNLTNGLHNVKIELRPDQPDKAEILKERHEKMDNPSRFDGTSFYAGAIMLVGELIDK